MNDQVTMDWKPDETEENAPDTMAGEHTTKSEPVGAPVEENQSEPEKQETGTELVAIEKYDMVKLFSEGGADPLIDEIEKQAESIITDVTTEKGRKEIASMAYRIARSKTTLDNEGKRLKEEAQKTVNVVDAERKKIRDRLDTLKEKVRAPLTEFEEREKERVNIHTTRLEALRSGDMFEFPDPDINQINERINLIEEIYRREWEEFAEAANAAYMNVRDRLNVLHDARVKRDEESAELERLRKEKEERERKEREEAIRKEEQEKVNHARIGAHEASLDRLSRLGEMSEDCTSIAITSRRSELKAVYDRDWEEFAEKAKSIYESGDAKLNDIHAKAVEREEKAEADKREAERKRAEEKAEREKQEAIEAERKRQEDEKRKEEEERQKREADKRHKKETQNDIYAALQKIQNDHPPQEWAIRLIEAMDVGEIPHVKIEY